MLRRLPLAVLLFLLLAARVRAQELLQRDFGPLDGLAHERVNAALEDPAGYLWLATWEGLSRFDGRAFVNYGTEAGLAVPLVFTLALDPEGRLWVSPHGRGVARLDATPDGRARFRSFQVGEGARANEVGALLFDERGVWAGTVAGVFRAREREAPSFEEVWAAPGPELEFQAALRAGGRGWLAGVEQVLELADDGVRVHAGCGGGEPRDTVRAQVTPDGRALVVSGAGLFVFDGAAAARGSEPWSRLDDELETGELEPVELEPGEVVHATALDARGRAWLATVHGLLVLEHGRARRITSSDGLPDDWLRALYFDRAGALWLGANEGGLTCLREPPIATYRMAGTRARVSCARVIEGSDGRVYASANDRGLLWLGPAGLEALPGSQDEPFRGVQNGVFQDAGGDWWLGGASGAWRVRGPELELARAERVPVVDGLGVLSPISQDERGLLWTGATNQGLYALDPQAREPRFERVLAGEELGGVFPRALVTTADGSTWIATNEALYRRRGSALERVRPRGELVPAGLEPRALLVDSRGWLWIGTRHSGAVFARTPADAEPLFERLSLREGLPSENVPALAEDAHGRLWLGTGRGLARFDPRDRSVRVFTSADGLAGETVADLARARDGSLWAAISGGLSHVDVDVEPAASPPPPVLVRHFEAGGHAFPVPEAGAARLAGLELAANERAVAIGFTGIDLANGAALRFQTRLEGLDDDWSAASAETSVRYGSLAPGSYRFLVRALARDGVASAVPAAVEFHLAAPLWRQPWFVALCVLALAGAVRGVQLVRARRRRALERVRSQIAGDLHDEVGAGLAQIAVRTEVARRAGPEAARAELGEVAELARATRSSMVDLVWAIDPRRDTLRDLLARLHDVTANLFGGGELELVLRVPQESEIDGLALAPDRRRHLLLFFKEAAQNAARHAHAARVEIELAVTSARRGQRLRLVLCDDGRGFDPAGVRAGHGLASLRERARALHATLVIDSAPGRGTRIELDVPL